MISYPKLYGKNDLLPMNLYILAFVDLFLLVSENGIMFDVEP
jgi:hypothetical protein